MEFRWSGVTVDCADPERLAAFWSALVPRERSESLPGWVRLGTVGDAVPVLNFQPVSEPRTTKNRLHLDLQVDDVSVAVARVVELGGRQLDRHDYDEGVVTVMADPEGNEFCLVQFY